MEKICSNPRQKRLIEAYEHARRYYGIHTQDDFAQYIGHGRNSMSSALNGQEKYLTTKLMEKVADKFVGIFNREYLLNGEGQLLTHEEEISKANADERIGKPAPAPQPVQVEIPEALQLLIDKTLAVSRHNDELVDRLAHAVSINKEIEITMRTVADVMKTERAHGDQLRCDLLTATEAINSFRTTVDTIRQENESLRQSNQHLTKRLDKAAELFARLNDQVATLMHSRLHYPTTNDDLPTANEPISPTNVSPNK